MVDTNVKNPYRSFQAAERRSAGGSLWRKVAAWLRGEPNARSNAFCSFCRNSNRAVGPLVEGPDDVYICYDCTMLCKDILEAEYSSLGKKLPTSPGKSE
ncbi:MAG TPA: ClpX C4-type zinc finger protein [Pirellulales bacterium]|nr:ClpX C4-type zinc finger protein [Pirellulales bacterium]